MSLDRGTDAVFGLVVVALVAAALVIAGVVPVPVLSGYDGASVTVYDENGTELGTVKVRVADTFPKRHTGLSDTDSLDRDEGMLFVHGEETNRSYVMRDMDFPIDIVFVGADGRINRIHHASVPPPDRSEHELTRYRGRAKWVLEVNYEWTTRNGVEVGDRIEVEGAPGPNATATSTRERDES